MYINLGFVQTNVLSTKYYTTDLLKLETSEENKMYG